MDKNIHGVLVLEPGVAGWYWKMNRLSYDGPYMHLHLQLVPDGTFEKAIKR